MADRVFDIAISSPNIASHIWARRTNSLPHGISNSNADTRPNTQTNVCALIPAIKKTFIPALAPTIKTTKLQTHWSAIFAAFRAAHKEANEATHWPALITTFSPALAATHVSTQPTFITTLSPTI